MNPDQTSDGKAPDGADTAIGQYRKSFATGSRKFAFPSFHAEGIGLRAAKELDK